MRKHIIVLIAVFIIMNIQVIDTNAATKPVTIAFNGSITGSTTTSCPGYYIYYRCDDAASQDSIKEDHEDDHNLHHFGSGGEEYKNITINGRTENHRYHSWQRATTYDGSRYSGWVAERWWKLYTRCNVCGATNQYGDGDNQVDANSTYTGCPGTTYWAHHSSSFNGTHHWTSSSDGWSSCLYCEQRYYTYTGACGRTISRYANIRLKSTANYINPDGIATSKNLTGTGDATIIVSYNSKATILINRENDFENGTITGYSLVINGIEGGIVGDAYNNSSNRDYAVTFERNITDYTTVQFHIYTKIGNYYTPMVEIIPGVIFNYHDNNTSSLDYNGSNASTSGSVPMTIVKYGSYNYIATNNYKISTYNKKATRIYRTDKVNSREHTSDNGLPVWNTKPDGSGDTFLEGQYVSYNWLVSNFGYVINLYAQWERYAVFKFDANGGSAVTTTMKVLTGDKMGELPTTSRSGYHFDGWYTAKDGGQIVTANTVSYWTSPTGTSSPNITLYAHWVKDDSPSVLGQSINYYEDTTFNVLETGYYLLEAFGGRGASLNNFGTGTDGGYGGYSKAFVFLEKGDKVYIHVGKAEDASHGGGRASKLKVSKNYTTEIINGQTVTQNNTKYTNIYVGDGGGSSDFRIGGNGLENRIIVAGGGGATGIKSLDMNKVTGTYQHVGLTTTSTETNVNTGVISTVSKTNGSGSTNGTKYTGTSGTPSGGGGGYYGGTSANYSYGSSGSNYIADKVPTLTQGTQWIIKPEYNEINSGYNTRDNGYCRITPYYTVNLDANSPLTSNGYEVNSSSAAYVDNYDTYLDTTALPKYITDRINEHNTLYTKSKGNYVNPRFSIVLVSTTGDYALNKYQQLPIASLKGWNFQGWHKTADKSDDSEVKDSDSVYSYLKGSTLVSDKWLYGQWTEQEYYIEYNANNTYDNIYGDSISTKNHYPFGVNNGKVATSRDAFYDTKLVDTSKLGGTYYDSTDGTVVKLDGDNLTYNSATDTYKQKVKYDHYVQILPNYFTKVGYYFTMWANQVDTNMYYDNTGKGVGNGTGKIITDSNKLKYWNSQFYDAYEVALAGSKGVDYYGSRSVSRSDNVLYNNQIRSQFIDFKNGQEFIQSEGNFNYIVNAKQIYASKHNKTEAIANMKKIYSGFSTSTSPRWIYSLANASDNNRKYYKNTTKLNSAGNDYITNSDSSDGGYNQKGGYSETYQCYANQIQFSTQTKSGQQNVQLYACWEPIKYKLEFNGTDNWNLVVSNYYQTVPMKSTYNGSDSGTGYTIRYDQIFTLLPNRFTRSTSDGKKIKIDKSISMQDAIDKYYLFDLDTTNAEDVELWNNLANGTEIDIKEGYTWIAWGLGKPINEYNSGETYSTSNWKLKEVNKYANVKQLWNWSPGVDANHIMVWKNQTLYGADYIDQKEVKNVFSDEAIQSITKYITDQSKNKATLSTGNGAHNYYLNNGDYYTELETPIESNLYSIWYNGKQDKLTAQNPSPDGGTYEPSIPTSPTEGTQIVSPTGPDGTDDNNGYSTTITFNFNGGYKNGISGDSYRMTMNKANVYFSKLYINGNINKYNDKSITSKFDSYGVNSITNKKNNFNEKTGINSNGFNKLSTQGNQLRFCGWNVDKGRINPNITEVDNKLIQCSKVNLDEFDVTRSNNVVLVANDLTLYAVWEPVPRLQLTLSDITQGNVINATSNMTGSYGDVIKSNNDILYDVARGDRLQYSILNMGPNRGTIKNKDGLYEETVATISVTVDNAIKEMYSLNTSLNKDSLNNIVTQDSKETTKNIDECANEGLSSSVALDRHICGDHNNKITDAMSNGTMNNFLRYCVGSGTNDNVVRYLDNRVIRDISVPMNLGTDNSKAVGYTPMKDKYIISVHMEVPTNFSRLTTGTEKVNNIIKFSMKGVPGVDGEDTPGPDDRDPDINDLTSPDSKAGEIKTILD